MSINQNYLSSVTQIFRSYKSLAEKAMSQTPDEKLFVQMNEDSNSIAMIVQHMAGNMLSRWTDFLTTDGEKEWRMRDDEFEVVLRTKDEMVQQWEKGWACLFSALDSLEAGQLQEIVYIRSEAHTVMEAINRQVAHYSYHVGQIVLLAKMMKQGEWNSLSIPKRKKV